MEKVIFLDRDGTINKEVHYLHKKEDLIFLPHAVEALSAWKSDGYRLVVVTNQSGIAYGYYGEEEVKKLHRDMNEMLRPYQAEIDAFFYCPHHPQKGLGKYKVTCSCRKPGIGMFLQAEKLFSIDKQHSFMVGDKAIDVEAGRNFGLRGILVATGYGKEIKEQGFTAYDFFAEDLKEAREYTRNIT